MRLIFASLLALFSFGLSAQFSVPAGGISLDFDTYEGTSATVPAGIAVATGSFRGIGTGSTASGGAYSYSTTGGDNSLGGLHSGGNGEITYTLSFVNGSSSPIEEMTISYDFEQYRFQNSSGITVTGGGGLGAANLSALDQLGNNGGSNGTVESTDKSTTLTGLNIAGGAAFSISFEIGDASGSDNGMAVDNFSISSLVLPVKMSMIDVSNTNSSNKLRWETAQEINNDFFEVQYSKDGRSFNTISTLEGNGTTDDAIRYEYLHKDVTSGMHYYQIKQVDYDGTSTIYGPVSTRSTASNLRFFPSTTQGILNFEGYEEGDQYTLINTNGKIISQGLLENQLDFTSIPSGVYFLNHRNTSSKIIKL